MKKPSKAAKAKGYKCHCGTWHDFAVYVYAHWNDELVHKCEQCGGKAIILQGEATLAAPKIEEAMSEAEKWLESFEPYPMGQRQWLLDAFTAGQAAGLERAAAIAIAELSEDVGPLIAAAIRKGE